MKETEGIVSRSGVLQELAAIAMARATDYLQIRDGALEIRSTDQLTVQQAAAIASVERTTGGLKVKFYDKLKALELLGKCLGLFDFGEVSGQTHNNLLEALTAAAGEEVPFDDLPEIQQAAESGHDLVEQTKAEGS